MSAQRECLVNLAASAAALASWPMATVGCRMSTWPRGAAGRPGQVAFAPQDWVWIFRNPLRKSIYCQFRSGAFF